MTTRSPNMTWSGQNLSTLRTSNRSTVLRLLHRRRGLSRRELARQTGLDASTISHIIGEFLTNGLVGECEQARPEEQPRRGRRRIGLELLPTAAYAIGIHLGVRALRVAACDLFGQIVARRATLIAPGTPPEVVLADAVRLAGDIAGEGNLRGRRIVGVGIGAVAFLDPMAGVIQSAPSLGWGEVPVSGPLSEQLDLPVLLDHHVRAMAVAEQWFGQAQSVPNFALVNVDTSIGVGIAVDGQVVRGQNARAGQIAHMVVAEDGPLCACGQHGCLVMLASYRALAARALDRVRQHPDLPLAHAIAEHPSVPPEYVVFELAGQDDPVARELVEELAGYIARVLTHLVALVDPQLMVLSAASAEHAAVLVEPIRQRVAAQAPVTPRIVASALDGDLATLGGAALALNRFVAGPFPGSGTGRRLLAQL